MLRILCLAAVVVAASGQDNGDKKLQEHFGKHHDNLARADVIHLFISCPPDDRPAAVKYIYDSLRPGGWLALFEHNPWNPAVVYVMNHSPLDQDAIRVKPHQARRLLQAGGFSIVKTDYLFFFPAFLSLFRGLEPLLSRVPFGAQYLALGRKA